MFGILSKYNRYGRNPVVMLGLMTHFIAFYLIFLNISSDAPQAPAAGAQMPTYLSPRYQKHRRGCRQTVLRTLLRTTRTIM